MIGTEISGNASWASEQYETLWEKWDLFVPFIEKGFRLLRRGGAIAYIVSDAYCHAKYAEKSQGWFVAECAHCSTGLPKQASHFRGGREKRGLRLPEGGWLPEQAAAETSRKGDSDRSPSWPRTNSAS